jgi:transcriptional regulator with XRE-family HTH domain
MVGAKLMPPGSMLMQLRLRQMREARAMSQAELAERAGLARLSVIRIELGRVRPRMYTVRLLAEALGVEPRDLLAETDGIPRR